jgi:arsenate reductase
VTEFDAATQLHLKKELEALHSEFGDVFPAERIDGVMQDSIARLRTPSCVETYLPALASRLARERLRAMSQVAGSTAKDVPEVLFVSLYDMGRAQLAAALMRLDAGDRVSVHSAASSPDLADVDANVKVALEEVGVDVDTAYSKPLTEEVLDAADVVVTMGRSVGRVEVPQGTDHRDWRIGDPGGAPLDEARRIRDDIDTRVRALLDELTEPEPADASA